MFLTFYLKTQYLLSILSVISALFLLCNGSRYYPIPHNLEYYKAVSTTKIKYYFLKNIIIIMEITLGHTPDADDAFMFYGIASGKVKSPNIRIKHVIEDIETLNRRALKHELDVTAVSAHAYAYLKDYVILRSGGSFGLEYGP